MSEQNDFEQHLLKERKRETETCYVCQDAECNLMHIQREVIDHYISPFELASMSDSALRTKTLPMENQPRCEGTEMGNTRHAAATGWAYHLGKKEHADAVC